MFIPGTAFLGDLPDSWFLGISPNAFGAVGAVVNFVVAYGVSKVTAPPPEHIQAMIEEVREKFSLSYASLAEQRGLHQLGSLGSGNHFCELGYVAEIYDDEAGAIRSFGPA